MVSHDPNTLRCFGVNHEITKTPFKGVLDQLTIANPKADLSDDSDDAKSENSYSQEQRAQLSEAMHKKALNLETPQYIPTFEQVARKFASDEKYHGIRLMIDIKMTNEPWVVGKIVNILRSVNPDLEGFWAPRTVLGIWRLDVLKAAQVDAPVFKVAHIGVSRSLARRFMEYSQVSAISLHHIALTAGSGGDQLISDAKSQGRFVYTWTVNTVQLMKWAVASDLDGIITDHPDLYSKLRSELTDEHIAEVYAPESASYKFVSWSDRNIRNMFSYYMLQGLMYLKMGLMYLGPSRELVE